MGWRPQRGTHVAYGTRGTSGIHSRVGIHDRDKALGRIGTLQDDLDPVQSLITLTTLLRPVPA